MPRLILRRIWALAPLLLIATLVAFLLLQLSPTDPAVVRLGDNATDEAYAAYRSEIGVDKPILVQYMSWLSGALRGDLGESWQNGAAASDQLVRRLPVTASVALGALAVGLCIGIPGGIAAGIRAGRPSDAAITGLASFGQAVPNFWMAILLVAYLAIPYDIFPAVGYTGITESAADWARSIALPSLALGTAAAAAIARQTRAGFIQVLHQPYIRTAVAAGLPRRQILFRTALRNASIPVATTVAAQASIMLGGAVIIEQVFALPGLGQLALNAIRNADMPLVMGFVALTAVMTALVQLILDIAYSLLDPRVRSN